MNTIMLNGILTEWNLPTSVAQLILDLDLEPKLVAVEVDRTVIPRIQHDATYLTGGESVEVVTFVGGG